MGNAKQLRKYLSEKWDVDALDQGGRTALAVAQDAECARLLIEAGSDMSLEVNRTQAILDAASFRSAEHLMVLLDAGCDIEGRDDAKRTPLILASMKNSADVVELLCKRGAKVNVVEKYGHTALSWAAWSNDEADLLKTLIKAGADIEKPDNRGRTPLYFASTKSAEHTRLLLATGAKTDCLNWNPLMKAIANGDAKSVATELKKNADNADDKDACDRSVMHLAAYLGNAEIIELLSKKLVPTDVLDADRRTPLHYAVLWGTTGNAISLIENGASLESTDKQEASPLWYSKDREMAKVLIDRGAKVNENSKIRLPLLFKTLGYVTWKGRQPDNPKILKTLIELGIDSTQTIDGPFGETGITPLMHACSHGSVESVRLLIESGADVNAKNGNGRTAMHYAAKGRSPAVIQLLRKHGAQVDLRDKEGITPLLETVQYGVNAEVLHELIKAGANVNATREFSKSSAIHLCRDFEFLKLLLENGANVNALDSRDETALFSPAQFRNYWKLEMLLEHGCNLDSKNNSGETALFVAVRAGAVPQIKLLLSQGADTSIQNKYDQSMLDIANKIKEAKVRSEVLQLLQNQAKSGE